MKKEAQESGMAKKKIEEEKQCRSVARRSDEKTSTSLSFGIL